MPAFYWNDLRHLLRGPKLLTTRARVAASLVVVLGCAPTSPPAASSAYGSEALRIEKDPPPAGARRLRELRAVDGKGCGLLGTLGSYDGAVNKLYEQARTLGADYVQITDVKEPFADHECVQKEYVVTGVAYRVNRAPAPAAPSAASAPRPAPTSSAAGVLIPGTAGAAAAAAAPARSVRLGSATYSFGAEGSGSSRSLSLSLRLPSGTHFVLWVDAAAPYVNPDGLELAYDPGAHRVALLRTPGKQAVAVGPEPFYLDEQWHTWRVLRTPDRVEVSIDGHLLLLNASPAPSGERRFALVGENVEMGNIVSSAVD